MSKPSTPVRRSKVGPGRPGSAGSEIPETASMEVLTPDPSVPPHIAASELGRSQDLYMPPIGSKPRTPGSAALVRTRSQDGRRSALAGSHEVIPLTSTTSKSISAHPLALQMPIGGSPAVSIIAQASAALPPQSPYAGGPAQGGMTPTGMSSSSFQPGVRTRAQADVSISTASSRFNPVVEDDDMMPPLPAQQPQQRQDPAGASGARESQVVVSGSASAIAQRAASSAAGAGRRYAVADSVAMSLDPEAQLQPQSGERSGTAGEAGGAEGSVPGTPGSVASGRIGGVFFTDLHRSFGGTPRGPGVNDSQDLGGTIANGEEEEEEDGDGRQRASRQTRFSTVTSRLNPMQSPNSSEDGDEDDDFAEYAGEAVMRSEAETGRGAGEDSEAASDRRTSTSALTDYINPVQTPYDSRLATPLITTTGEASERPTTAASTESRKSLLLMIRDLYVTEPQPSASELSRPATAASEPAPPTPAPQQPAEEEVEGDPAADESEALAASRAAVAALAAKTDSEQLRRRSELGDYMTALQDLKDDSGGKLVELPADWGVMLERLFRQRRAEFATLEGWMGPHRFEDLPISQLPADHPDPRVEEGLARIRELDAVLNDKLIAALISHRETFPDQWAEQERRRLEKHTKVVEEALKRERQKRLRAARISRAVTALDGPEGLMEEEDSADMAQGSARALAGQPSVYSRMFTLRPEEEALVEAVMQRNDEEGAAINPFDLESAATYGGGPATETGEAAGAACDGAPGEWADADDIDLELDMFLPSASASACATPSAATKLMRPLSARLTEAEGGAGTGLRPLSAASYSSSRPGTSSGLIGGMSPIAAAALHGHPVLLAAGANLTGNPRASATGGAGAGGLLPERVYEDPRAAARALRAINARLAAFESEHLWDESGALADFKSVVATQQSPQQQQGRKQGQPPGAEASAGPGLGSAPSVGPGSQASPPGPGAGARASSPPRSVKSAAGGPAASVSGVSVTAAGQRDYLREERVAKEIANREKDVDAALRSLKTSEVVKLGEATLKALVEQCRRLQELNEHRRKIEEAEAAARKAQLQRQQLLSRGSDAGSGRGTPRGGSASSASGRGAHPGQPPAAAAAATATGPAAAGRAAAAAGGGGTSAPAAVEGSAPASSGRGPRPTAAAGSGGSGTPTGAAGAAGGGAATGLRQSSTGKTRTAAGGGTPTGSSQSAARRASDPATGSAGSGAAAGPSASPGPGSSGSSSSRAGKASAGGNGASASGGAVTAKPRSAGKTAALASSLDSGGLPPPPPPPPPPS